MSSKSPNNIRRINFSIAQGILEILSENEGWIEQNVLVSLGLDRAASIDNSINERTTKCTETLEELRRLSLLSKQRDKFGTQYQILPEGNSALERISKTGKSKVFFQLLLEHERIFKEFIDMIKRRDKVYNKDLMEISGINSVKISFVRSIAKQLPSIISITKEGRGQYYSYVGYEKLSEVELRREIINQYYNLIGTRLFLKIDELWKSLLNTFPDLSEDIFDDQLLSLVSEYMEKIELIQGIAEEHEKILFDKKMGTYFHYIKMTNE